MPETVGPSPAVASNAKPPGGYPAAQSKSYLLFLRRHYPVQVQTVGDELCRPLSLVCPSSRQNRV